MKRNGSYHKLYMNQFRELQVDAQIEQYEKQVEKKRANFRLDNLL